MAIYRNVHISFWTDPFVLELTPEEKYFFLYLMTNSKTTQIGIYELPKSIIQFETGYNQDTVDKLLSKFIGYNKIKYDESTKELMLSNWLKYNYSNSPKVISCMRKELKNVKSQNLKDEFNRVCIQYRYSIDTQTQEEEEQEEEQEETKEADARKFKEEFENFWNQYDKKVDRKKCFQKWKKLKADDKSEIFKTVQQYVKATPDKQYRKNPLTYLRNESWKDELPTNSNGAAKDEAILDDF